MPDDSHPFELGLDTFGDVTRDASGRSQQHDAVLRDVVEEGVQAEEAGVDFFGVGEHHREDFAISAPEIVLAAIAARTKTIRLGTSVTVLSSDDPIRVFQRLSTIAAISAGRAEVILGRGSFLESFPLFGLDLGRYDELFEDKLSLYAAVLEQDRSGAPFDWSGTTRPPLEQARVFPRTARGLRTWIGVGGTPQSVVRAARYGMPLVLAIIGGDPRRFLPYVTLYQEELEKRGRAPLPVAVHSPGHVAGTDEQARDEFWPPYRAMHDRIGAERGWPPMRRDDYEREIAHGSLYVGAPETVARKIAATALALGLARFTLKYSAGPLRHELMMQTIALYGREVRPRVREILAPQISKPAER